MQLPMRSAQINTGPVSPLEPSSSHEIGRSGFGGWKTCGDDVYLMLVYDASFKQDPGSNFEHVIRAHYLLYEDRLGPKEETQLPAGLATWRDSYYRYR